MPVHACKDIAGERFSSRFIRQWHEVPGANSELNVNIILNVMKIFQF
jgi:hypothetical protein